MFIEGEVIMTADDVLNNLLELIGKPFDYDDVVCAFEDYEVNSTQFLFKADENDVIKAVYMKGR